LEKKERASRFDKQNVNKKCDKDNFGCNKFIGSENYRIAEIKGSIWTTLPLYY
jgi:hypothetical protein